MPELNLKEFGLLVLSSPKVKPHKQQPWNSPCVFRLCARSLLEGLIRYFQAERRYLPRRKRAQLIRSLISELSIALTRRSKKISLVLYGKKFPSIIPVLA